MSLTDLHSKKVIYLAFGAAGLATIRILEDPVVSHRIIHVPRGDPADLCQDGSLRSHVGRGDDSGSHRLVRDAYRGILPVE